MPLTDGQIQAARRERRAARLQRQDKSDQPASRKVGKHGNTRALPHSTPSEQEQEHARAWSDEPPTPLPHPKQAEKEQR
jgi:hypothetical protein